MASTPDAPKSSQKGLSTAKQVGIGASREKPVITLGSLLGREAGGLVVLLILVALLILLTNTFLTPTNLGNLVRQVTVFAVLAVGELFVILTGGIDLSVGSILAMSSAITALLMVGGVPVLPALLIGIVAG